MKVGSLITIYSTKMTGHPQFCDSHLHVHVHVTTCMYMYMYMYIVITLIAVRIRENTCTHLQVCIEYINLQ